MRPSPPGWAPATRDAAKLLAPLFLRNAWAAMLILSPPLWMLFFVARLTRVTAVITGPPPQSGAASLPATAARVAAAGFWGAFAAFVLVLSSHPVGQLWFTCFAALHVGWLVWVAALFGFLHQLSRQGSALRGRVSRAGLLWTAGLGLLAVASAILPDLIWSLNVDTPPPWMAAALFGYGVGLIGMALLLPHTLAALLGAFWTAGDADLSLENIRAILEARFGAPLRSDGWGLAGERADGHRITSFRLELARAPGQLVVSVRDPRLPVQLAVFPRAQAPGVDRVSLADPLLDSALSVSGVSAAVAEQLLGGRHDTVMPVFHAHPSAVLFRQRLRVTIPGPPFAGCGNTPVDIASYVADRVEECVALVSLIQRRAGPAPVRQPILQRERR